MPVRMREQRSHRPPGCDPGAARGAWQAIDLRAITLDVVGRSLRDLVGDSVVMTAADGGAGPGARPGWRWHVALSFAAAQRDYVEQVAEALRARGVQCFYDADEQIDLWGKYLAEELPAIYGEQAAAVVVFMSAEYAARDWTRLERRVALGRAVRERREYVLPARFDDTPLPGLLTDIVAVDLRYRTPQQFAAMIAAKLAALGIIETAPPTDAGSPVKAVGPTGLAQVGEADPRAMGMQAAISVPGGPDERQFNYQDLDLLIEPDTAGSYRARVLRSPAGESAAVRFTLPFSPVELENFVLRVGRPRRITRGPGRPESAPLKDFGGKLYNAVFQNELGDMLLRSINLSSEQRAGLRLRLRLAGAPELAELPWEFLYDRRLNRFLVLSRWTPLVRYLDLPDPPRPLTMEGPLRVLVMISSPVGYLELDVEQEWRLVTEALAEQQEEGRVIVERLEANMGMLRRRLRRETYHVFHFVGHGHYRPDWGDGVLVMEDDTGRAHEVTGEELGGLLNEYDPTRLAVLNACEGARSDASDPFAGMAQSLIQQGLPAVVAMQYEITDEAAIIFARELYGAIADGLQLEAALAEARGGIRDQGNPTEWGTPVLYSRAPDGRLFNWTARVRISGAERKAREDAERKAREDAERKAREDAERKAREDAERKAREERKQLVLAKQVDMRRYAASRRWQDVLDVSAAIALIDPSAADPYGLATTARRELGHKDERPARVKEPSQQDLSTKFVTRLRELASKQSVYVGSTTDDKILLSAMADQLRTDETLVTMIRAWLSFAPRHMLADYTGAIVPADSRGLLTVTDRQLVFAAEATGWPRRSWTLAIPYAMINRTFDQHMRDSGTVSRIRTSAESPPQGVVALFLENGGWVEFRATKPDVIRVQREVRVRIAK
jgi:hypothetical protein